jgi:cytochrome c-type biogenesis protein CcmH
MKTLRLFLLWLALAPPCHAADEAALEARARRIESELRCVVCQNQTLADSNAGLAVDLRNEIRAQMAAGASDDQVLAFLVERYGEFVLYRPALRAGTLALWAGPLLLLLAGAVLLVPALRRQAQLPIELDDQRDG